ncbi:hypothetical protein CON36_33310 [Bacillus cereus]|uniref:Uncharacterized protein n=1 Tax=Bacillus cereus TaxID=1396 RepID=A0A9X6SSY4_BACCE|nr:hypothetical protein [Bacillus cereus]PDZ94537.1 hypothetical protein CON36_33310 [Bacillus cereus]PGP14427.1 hypothetical protein COA01_29110 [Bacillus cereus]
MQTLTENKQVNEVVEMSFVDSLNNQWQEFIEENKLQILIDSGDEKFEFILKQFIFEKATFERQIEGYYSEAYVVDEFDLTISLNGISETMGASPDCNKDTEVNWFLSPYLDTADGEVEIQNDKKFTETFGITKSQELSFQKVFDDFELLDKCEVENAKRQKIYLQKESESMQKFVKESYQVESCFKGNGILIKVTDTITGEVINEFTKVMDRIEI